MHYDLCAPLTRTRFRKNKKRDSIDKPNHYLIGSIKFHQVRRFAQAPTTRITIIGKGLAGIGFIALYASEVAA
jgi:hypothetical protein